MRAASGPQLPANRIGIDAMVCDPGGDHARFDRVVVEYPPHGGGVTHHGHLPLADKPRDGRSRHLRTPFGGN
ncbi:hypothetical protein J113_19885 [Mycobacterium tuberculosis CAS/NITR204]|uniref:Uncharacterized protein n=1 Tax=Mycobacterium tuberculosis CAS/NITR204 TaxID=1310114 RepID=R4MHA9_MYCTX|nr:hypothetical protein J113_19885 [Mycobacterium tuberculosis CAS/NITR204]